MALRVVLNGALSSTTQLGTNHRMARTTQPGPPKITLLGPLKRAQPGVLVTNQLSKISILPTRPKSMSSKNLQTTSTLKTPEIWTSLNKLSTASKSTADASKVSREKRLSCSYSKDTSDISLIFTGLLNPRDGGLLTMLNGPAITQNSTPTNNNTQLPMKNIKLKDSRMST